MNLEKPGQLLAKMIDDENLTKFQYFFRFEASNMLCNFQQLQTLEIVLASEELSLQLNKMSMPQTIWNGNINASNCDCFFQDLMPLMSLLCLYACDENETPGFQALKPVCKNVHRLIIKGD